MKEEVFITNSFEETQKIAEAFIKGLNPSRGSTPTVIALYGELGSGKTTFVQGLTKGLGIKRRIISPTFIIMRHYKLKIQNSKFKITSQNSKFFYHIDLYRIESEKEIEGLGLSEIIREKENIVAIEWAEKMRELLPKKRIDIWFEYLEENKRKITINNF